MIDARVLLGLPIEFNDVCLIYPPTVKDIITNPKGLQYYKLLTYSSDDIVDLLTNKEANTSHVSNIPTPLEFILINSYKSQNFESIIKDAFKFFIHQDITFLYENKLVLIGSIEKLANISDINSVKYLSEDNFFDFQNTLRTVMGMELEEPPISSDLDPAIRRVKELARRRKRAAKKTHEGKGISLSTSLSAICCMGIGLTPLNIGEISYASIGALTEMYQQKEKYQTDIDSLMAGADPKKVHPKYWIREQSDYQEIQI